MKKITVRAYNPNLRQYIPDEELHGDLIELVQDGVCYVEWGTGLNDRNGREVVQGDILYFFGWYLEVIWDKDNAQFDLENKMMRRGSFVFNRRSIADMEVVGNIHDNYNLIEKGFDNGEKEEVD